MDRPYELSLPASAARDLRRLPPAERSRVKAAIAAEAARLGDPGAGRGGRVDHAARTMRVLRVIDRRDLERWLRDR